MQNAPPSPSRAISEKKPCFASNHAAGTRRGTRQRALGEMSPRLGVLKSYLPLASLREQAYDNRCFPFLTSAIIPSAIGRLLGGEGTESHLA